MKGYYLLSDTQPSPVRAKTYRFFVECLKHLTCFILGFLSPNSSCCSYSGFGQTPAFSFAPQQQSRSSVTPNSSGDMQQQASQMSIDLSAAEFPSLSNRSVPQNNLVPSIRNYR